MRESLTAVLERRRLLDGPFRTEPYEAAWAAEARWFIRFLDRSGPGTRLVVTTQVSPDGLHWCDLDAPRTAADTLTTWSSTHFGGWLRLCGRVESDGAAFGAGPAAGASAAPSAAVMIHLALKS